MNTGVWNYSELNNMKNKTKILIIDDYEDIRNLMERNLSPAGFEVLKASNGEEGLELVDKEKPDLVLLDIDMPKMNGFEACRALREESANDSMPIIMLTGDDTPSNIVRALEQGADDYIIKMDGGKKLLKKIHSLLALAKTGNLPGRFFLEKRRKG